MTFPLEAGEHASGASLSVLVDAPRKVYTSHTLFYKLNCLLPPTIRLENGKSASRPFSCLYKIETAAWIHPLDRPYYFHFPGRGNGKKILRFSGPRPQVLRNIAAALLLQGPPPPHALYQIT
ncbi:MAG: hypothetical protein A3F09_04225 [Chlamydiae bacterium RIFCSPHIGHO2_12_FULL_49_11]|nr:MAG: hypothetical protein A3F09_04225 [Chlamydiae bacterium RIFCSPHIGHO2_12_FULL_49_11]